ncbi:ABC transporter ATP-binding protein [Rickettsiales bacterium]|nr:ABC transporter ATP-binding protein [Rickettsiales bacterium]
MKVLEINNINKSFSGQNILKDINLSVNSGEVFGLVGVNGIGKTTLIKIILDLLSSDDGEVNIFGKSSILTESRSNVAYLPEKFTPSQFLKGEEFLRLSCQQFNQKYKKDRAIDLCNNLDLDLNSLGQKITKYSKGMGQKLGLVSMFLSDADLLILDEPMSGLDPHVRIKLKELLKTLAKDMQKTIFFSSHILSDIDEISDRIAVINTGQIIFNGKPSDFKLKYQSESLEKAFLEAINKI